MRIACSAVMALSFVGAVICMFLAMDALTASNQNEVWVAVVSGFTFGVLSIGAGICATAFRTSGPDQPKPAPQYPPFGAPQAGPHTGQQPAIQQHGQQWPGQS